MKRLIKKDKNVSCIKLVPMGLKETGTGLPYAPENWPETGDIWKWRTGKRIITNAGHFHDRYLYLPDRLAVVAIREGIKKEVAKRKLEETLSPSSKPRRKYINTSRMHIFATKVSAVRYLNDFHPGTDLKAFFNRFQWKIPAKVPIEAEPIQKVADDEQSAPRPRRRGRPRKDAKPVKVAKPRKAGNKRGANRKLKEIENAPAKPSDVCGALPEETANIDGQYLPSCDCKSDMIPHANNLLQICEAVELEAQTRNEDMDIILALSELKHGTIVEAPSAEQVMDPMEVTMNDGPSEVAIGLKSDPSEKFESAVHYTLEALRRSQEKEYELAKELLNEQKNYLKNLYQHLNYEKDEFARVKPPGFDIPSDAIIERSNQIQQEEEKFGMMLEIGNGFGNTPNAIVKRFFSTEPWR